MKRIGIGVGAVVAVFALAAVAMATSRSYHGTVDPSGAVAFDAKVHNHKIVKVRNFVFDGVGAVCDEGPGTADILANPLPPMPLNARHRFRGDFKIEGTDKRAHVRGVFKHHGKRARGRLRLTGTFGGLTNCDTGRDRWKAHRG